MVDVRFARVELPDLRGIDIEAKDGKMFLAEAQHKRQTDIAQADDANAGSARLNTADQFIFHYNDALFTPTWRLSVSCLRAANQQGCIMETLCAQKISPILF